jgi:hypothetical protein
MSDIKRAEDYFRRSKDKNGDEKNLARGLLHLVKHLGLDKGRDFKRAQQLLDQAWKISGVASRRKTGEAMFLVARELDATSDKKGKRKTTSMTEKHAAVMADIDEKKAKLATSIMETEDED